MKIYIFFKIVKNTFSNKKLILNRLCYDFEKFFLKNYKSYENLYFFQNCEKCYFKYNNNFKSTLV